MAESASLAGAVERDEDAPRATPWWVRLVLVLVFHATVVLGQWWALAPNPGDLSTTPGLVPGLLVALAWVAWLPVLFQVSTRVNLWLMTGGLLLGLAGQWVLTPAVDDLYHNFAMQRSPNAVVTTSVVSPDNGAIHGRLRLSEGREVDAVLTVPADRSRFTWNSRGFLQPVHFGPFVEVGPGARVDALADPHGISPAINADSDDTTAAGKRVALWWLAGALVAWIPIELLVLSSLTRRRAWWGMPMSEIRSRQAI